MALVRGEDLAALQHLPHAGRDAHLAGMRSHRLNGLVQRRVGAAKGFETGGGRHFGRLQQHCSVVQRQHADRRHKLGAVDQRQALFGRELDRLDPRPFESFGTGKDLVASFNGGFALTQQHQREMRKWSQIAAGADRALRRYHRRDTVIEQVDQPLDHHLTHTGKTLGQGVRAQEQHGAHDVARQSRADARRMGADQVVLQVGELIGRDRDGAEVAKSGVDAVGGFAAGNNRFDQRAGAGNGIPGGLRQRHRHVEPRHFNDLRQRQMFAIHLSRIWAPSARMITGSSALPASDIIVHVRHSLLLRIRTLVVASRQCLRVSARRHRVSSMARATCLIKTTS